VREGRCVAAGGAAGLSPAPAAGGCDTPRAPHTHLSSRDAVMGRGAGERPRRAAALEDASACNARKRT
jgi:hypothetical protein